MTTARVKSRIRFQGRVKRDRKNKKYAPDQPKSKQTNNDAHGPTNSRKVYMFSVDVDGQTYDDSNSVDESSAPFFKKRVLTTDDQKAPPITKSPDAAGSDAVKYDHESNGASNSSHPTKPKDSCVPSVSGSPDAQESVADEDDEPPDSFLMRAPLWAWPAEWFPADAIPVAPETTTESSPEVACGTASSSPVTVDATVDPSQATEETTTDLSPVTEETSADPSQATEESTSDSPPLDEESVAVSSSATAENAAVSSSVGAETISDLSSASADTISDLSSESADVTTDSSPAVTVTATSLCPVAAVATVNPTLVTAAPTTNPGPVVVKSTAAPSLGPWHQLLIRLFAGRKSKKANKTPQSVAEQPASIISWARERSDSKPEIVLPPLPRLELPRALEETRHKKNGMIDRPGHAIDIPQAPYHDYIGRAVLGGDADDATIVQRGFRVGNNSDLAPLAQRRNNSDSSLLDREGDVWAAWNKLNITADGMPFAESQSATDLLHPRTGARMARNTGIYGADQTKGQTGHCFLEDAGHRYPFGAQGLF